MGVGEAYTSWRSWPCSTSLDVAWTFRNGYDTKSNNKDRERCLQLSCSSKPIARSQHGHPTITTDTGQGPNNGSWLHNKGTRFTQTLCQVDSRAHRHEGRFRQWRSCSISSWRWLPRLDSQLRVRPYFAPRIRWCSKWMGTASTTNSTWVSFAIVCSRLGRNPCESGCGS